MIRATLRVLAVAGGLLAANGAWAQDIVTTAPQAPSPPPEPAAQAPSPAPEPTPPETPAPAAELQAQPPAQDQMGTPAVVPATPAPVQAQPLTQLDLFSTGRDTGLGADVWKGSSADIARAVIPSLVTKPLSPAATNLARRLLAQTSTAPTGAGNDLDLAVARARALLALGDAEDASLVLDRTPGVADHADLSGLAAEAALISEQDDKACGIAQNLTDGRDGLYWLRLRAFCQARAGKADEAQLTFNLAGGEGQDDATARLLGVFIAGVGDPGPARARSGLEYALSRALKLDLGVALATASPAISSHMELAGIGTTDPVKLYGFSTNDPARMKVLEAARALSNGEPYSQLLEQLVDQGAHSTGPRVPAQAAAMILASLGGDLTGASRAQLADFGLISSKASDSRLLALNIAADAGLKGETALLALQIAQYGSASGPALGDRCEIIRALNRVGLKEDARAFAIEGLMALRGIG